jgi:hypothetical protein
MVSGSYCRSRRFLLCGYDRPVRELFADLAAAVLLGYTVPLQNRGVTQKKEVRLEDNPFAPVGVHRGLRRQGHVLLVLVVVFLVWFGSDPSSANPSVLSGASGLLFFALLVPIGVQFFFNRPKFLVPRRFRSEAGVLADYGADIMRLIRRVRASRER